MRPQKRQRIFKVIVNDTADRHFITMFSGSQEFCRGELALLARFAMNRQRSAMVISPNRDALIVTDRAGNVEFYRVVEEV
jgi:hypothetical protein